MVDPESSLPTNPHFPAATDDDMPVVSGRPGNPFLADVCDGPFSVEESKSVPGMNVDIVRQLSDAIDDRQKNAGRKSGQPLMLLTAPRAGYGKTHLLGRVAEAAGGQVVLLPLAFRMGDEIGFPAVGRRGLEALARAEGTRPGWTRLRETCAGVWSTLLRRLISDGTLPCANPEQALKVLEGHPADVFDPDGPARLIGDWLKKHSAPLRKPMSALASRVTGVAQDELDAWLQAMLEQGVEGGNAGLGLLRQLVAMPGEEPCLNWLRLLSVWRPVVLLVDHLDAYYRNPDAGLKIASLLLDIADMDEVHVVLSLNQDVWQATFGHHLPSAVEDRLTASQVLLRGVTAKDATALIRLRLSEADVSADDAKEFQSFLGIERYFLGRPLGSVSARAFLRHAAQQWEAFKHSVASPDEFGMEEEDEDDLPTLVIGGDEFGEAPLDPADDDGEPAVFDDDTGDYVKRVAQGLSEPQHALPQENEPELPTEETSEPEPSDPATPQAATDSFVKLREMLVKLKEPQGTRDPSSGNQPNGTPSPGSANEHSQVVQRLASVMAGAGAATAAGSPTSDEASAPEESRASTGDPKQDALLGRFEALALQMSAEADSLGLDYTKLGDLIRLAGRRFPLVRLSEHELPGLTGRYAMMWTLQGAEILFGLAQFTDTSYWKTVATFAAGRQAELGVAGNAPVNFKIATFKTDRESQVWQELHDSDTFPDSVKSRLDPIALNARSVASLYAMQRIIKDAESGAIQAEPSEVMSVLARELDFFWKRVTRPLTVSE